MPYDLLVDGKAVDLGDRKYLLSPQDLAGLEVLPELVRAGVSCFKIEGRLKSPEYVANVTRVYRQALDRVMAGVEDGEAEAERGSLQFSVSPQEHYSLEMAFSRGLHTGWFRGINNQELVHARFAKKRGVYLGQVVGISKSGVRVQLQAPLKPGDGVVFDSGHPEASEVGGRVYSVEERGNVALLTFGWRDLDLRRVSVGDRVWKTSDPELDRRLRQSFAGEIPQCQRPIWIEVQGEVGQPLIVVARDRLGHVVQVESAMPLVAAHTKPLTSDRLREQLGRLGNTPFRLEALTNHLSDKVLLPLSELNRLRREFVDQLEELCSRPQRWQLHPAASYQDLLPLQTASASPLAPELVVLVRNLRQLKAALVAGVGTLYCEFEDPRAYRQAVQLVQQEKISATQTIWVAPPRITKLGENWILQQVRASNADGYLVRNYDHLQFFAQDCCIGDFALNVANPLTASYFQGLGLERLTAS